MIQGSVSDGLALLKHERQHKSLGTSDSSEARSQTYLTFGNGLCHNGNTLGLSLNHRLLLYERDLVPGNHLVLPLE